MNKLLSNPYVLGGIGGMIALLISYIEQADIKKHLFTLLSPLIMNL